MEWWQVWFILKLDAIIEVVFRLGAAFIVAMFLIIPAIMHYYGSILKEASDITFRRNFKVCAACIVISITMFSISSLAPTTKEAAIIWGIHTATHNERIDRGVDSALDSIERLAAGLVNTVEHKLNEMGHD